MSARRHEKAEISEMRVVFDIDEIDLVHDHGCWFKTSKACAPRDARARQRHATPINQTDGVHRSE